MNIMELNLLQGLPASAVITINAAVLYFHTYREGIKNADSHKVGAVVVLVRVEMWVCCEYERFLWESWIPHVSDVFAFF